MLTIQNLYKAKEQHLAVLNTALAKDDGQHKEVILNDIRMCKEANLYWIDNKSTSYIKDHINEEGDDPEFPAASGFIGLQEDIGLKQLVSPMLELQGTAPRFTIHGLYWQFDLDKNVILNPLFDAQELRRTDPNLMQRRYYTGLFPYIGQIGLLRLFGPTEEIKQPYLLMRSICTGIEERGIKSFSFRVKEGKKNTNKKYFMLNDEPIEPKPLPIIPSIQLSPTSLPLSYQNYLVQPKS